MNKNTFPENNIGNKAPKFFSKKHTLYRYTTVIFFAFFLIIGSAVVMWKIHKNTTNIYNNTAISDVENFAASVSQFRNFYSKKIVPIAKEHGMTLTHDYAHQAGTLPLPATFAKDFGESLSSSSSSFSVKLYSGLPFPWRNESLDDFEKNALKLLQKNPEKAIWSFETLNGQPVLRYAKADILKESCIACHNSYQGTPKADWKVGDVRGVLEVIRPMSDFEFESYGMLKNSFLIMLALILSMVFLIFFILKKLSSSTRIAYNSYLSSEQANKKLVDEMQRSQKISHALKASDIKMRTIVNSVQELIIVIDKTGIITECNNIIETMFDYQKEDVLGKNISMLMTSNHQSNHDTYIQKYLNGITGSVMGKSREFFAQRKNGDKFPIELFVSDARVGDNIMFTGTIRDITHQKKEQEAIATAHKAAIDSAELKSEFLANMSHEIRTPMNGVIGMTEMLLLSTLDKEQTELAQTVKESAHSLLVIINDILDFSKIEAGKLSIKKAPFQLLPMIEGAIDLLAKEADRKRLDLTFFIDKSVPLEINSDAGRLRQVLINLLNNALKFTEQGHVILTLSLHDKSHLKFSVIDTGMGIAKKNQDTLFDTFSQVDGSSSRQHGGTGLGLAICKQLAELMGGAVGAESKKGEGSTFWFTIEIEEPKVTQLPYINAPISVLILNTSPLISWFYKEQMRSWGMQAKLVSNINQMIDNLNNSFDMISIDTDNIFIDKSDPQAFFSIIKVIQQKTDAHIVLYASQTQFITLNSLALGNNVHTLSKPIKHSMIKDLLSQLHVDDKAITIRPKISDAAKHPTDETIEDFHVLLAEDNKVNQMVAVAVLGKLGCEVTVANNGEVAIQYLQNNHFDAVFMDCQMPVMDGYEASRRIRQFETSHPNKTIPIIAFTAHAMKDDDKKCKEAGMDDCLSKPIDLDELKKVLRHWKKKMQHHKCIRIDHQEKVG